MNVWEPFVDDYHKMGWLIVTRIVEDRGSYSSWLMVWCCDCKVPRLPQRVH
jgi:hypothetical protein